MERKRVLNICWTTNKKQMNCDGEEVNFNEIENNTFPHDMREREKQNGAKIK